MSVSFGEPIAIVGIGCRFPGGAKSPEEFWRFLCDKACGIREIPDDRWSLDTFYDADPAAIARSTTKWGGFLDSVRYFDPEFFGVSSREAGSMDPQQRILLQVVYEALQDASLRISDIQAEKTGVFVGVSTSDYGSLQRYRRTNNDIYAGTGSALSIVANRISHRFDLSGPSYSVDTACSSSLVALDQACWSLNEGTSSYAIVGGVNILVDPGAFIAFSKAGMLSRTGTISTFDAVANGYVRGEGCGAVVLKRLSDARRDQDRIHAVIRATSVNQDGHTPTLTAPNRDRQVAMLQTLCERASVDPATVDYVEAHGTGTPVGDPLEASAIGNVFGVVRDDEPVLVGSLKPNIGHLESAAGISGLIKTALTVRSRAVPPNRNFKDPNPNIPFDLLGIKVPTELTEIGNGVCRAAVNSFGFGGTNASALLESAETIDVHPVRARVRPKSKKKKDGRQALVPIPVSAGTENSLREYCSALAAELVPDGALADADLADIAANMMAQRDPLRHRAVLLAGSPAGFHDLLMEVAEDRVPEPEPRKLPYTVVGRAGRPGKVAFTFAGQGGQWYAMGRRLLDEQPAFRSTVEEFDDLFKKSSGWSIISELNKSEARTKVHDPAVTQPGIFAVQIGLAALWKRAGVKPDFILGHSFGEVAAAYVAGGLSLETATHLIHMRGLISRHIDGEGAMIAVGLPPEEARDFLGPDSTVDIAAFNGPAMVTLSGDASEVDELFDRFESERPDVLVRRLAMSIAWHSRQLGQAEKWFKKSLGKIAWRTPTVPLISTVSGAPHTCLDGDYWWANLRQPVAYQTAVEHALDLGAELFLELGPHRTLSGLTATIASAHDRKASIANSLIQGVDDFHAVGHAAATLYVSGVDIDFSAFAGKAATKVELPRYPWDEVECWVESEESRQLLREAPVHPLLGTRPDGPQVVWESEINLNVMAYIVDHSVGGDVIFPASGYIDMMIAAGENFFGKTPIELESLAILEALFITSEDQVLLRTAFDPDTGRIRIFSHLRDSATGWVERANARLLQPSVEVPPAPQPSSEEPMGRIGRKDFYALADRHGYQYGTEFQGVADAVYWPERVEAEVVGGPHTSRHFADYPAHPALLDSCFQSGIPMATIAEGLPVVLSTDEIEEAPHYPMYLPVGVEQIRYFSPLPPKTRTTAIRRGEGTRDSASDIFITDEAGNLCMTIKGFRTQRMSGEEAAKDEATTAPRFIFETYASIPAPAPPASQADNQAASWLVFRDAGGVCNSIVAELEASGATTEAVEIDDDGAVDCDVVAQLLSDWIARSEGELGILVGHPLDTVELGPDTETESLGAAVEKNVLKLLALGKALDTIRDSGSDLSIWLVSRGARKLPDDPALSVGGLVQAPLTGMMRTVAAEVREFSFFHVDFSDAEVAEIANCVGLMRVGTTESELLLRGDAVYAPRLESPETSALPRRPISVVPGRSDINFVATMRAPGSLDDIQLEEAPLGDLADDNVRIAVEAVGLNFRDIMAATGLLPKEAESEPAYRNLGLEYAGSVVETGAKVSSLSPGDRVMGMGRRCLQGYIDQPAAILSKLPDALTSEDASTIPSAYATAHYALNHIGRLRQGEKVLIHVATGGVGLAAIQLAKKVGAEIFATAGSDRKREHLMNLGVDHVMNSRSLDFADEIAAITGGGGVDVVLNSLPGDFILKGLESLAPYGRFLEIGKRDVYMDSLVGMKALRKNITLSVIDLAAMGHERPDLLSQLTEDVLEMIAAGEIAPLPTTVFPIADVSEAFRYMSQARHIGKVVVNMPQEPVPVFSSADKPLQLHGDRSYLVTGGSRGFGLAVADWLSACGAGRIVLASRSGAPDAGAEPVIDAITDRGTEVVNVALDITDAKAVAEFVSTMAAGKNALAGVVHGAAVIKDGFLWQLENDTVLDVLRPKVLGAWNLHRAVTRAGLDLDFFISFSSLAQVLGSIGQANYVAANAFLDAFAHYRQGQGQTGQTIDWGALGESGFVARSDSMTNYLESVGLIAVNNHDATGALGALQRLDVPSIAFAAVDWASVGRASGESAAVPRLQNMLSTDAGGGGRIRADIAAAPRGEWTALLTAFLIDQVSKVLKVDGSEVNAEQALTELGFDSLSSIELKNRVEGQLGLSIPMSAFLQTPTLNGLADAIALALDEEVRKRAATEERALGGAGEGGRETSSRLEFRATHDQDVAIAASLGPFASESGRRALEHRILLRLPTAPKPGSVATAFSRLVRRHSLLRLALTTDIAGGDVKLGLDGTPPKLRHVDDAAKEMDASLAVGDGELVRVAYSEAGGKAKLGLIVHTAITDRVGFLALVEELLRLIDGEKLGRKPPEKALLAALFSRRFDEEAPASSAARAYWDALLSRGVSSTTLDSRKRALLPLRLGSNRGPTETLSFDIKSTGRDEEIETELLAAFAQTVLGNSKQSEFVVECHVATRSPDVDDNVVGPFADQFPVVVRVGDTDSSAVTVQIRRQLHAGRAHAILGTSYAETIVASDHQAEAALRQFGFRFANKVDGRPGSMSVDGQPVKVISDHIAVASPHELALLVSRTSRSKLKASLRFDSEVFSESQVRKIADAVKKLCERSSAAAGQTARRKVSRGRAGNTRRADGRQRESSIGQAPAE